MRRGRKSAAQTPAPPKERIYGSKVNKKGSASGGKSIKFSKKTETALKNKLNEFKNENKNSKITLSTLKAVYRRGLGAYSSSHRPTITGGVPNTRNAWAMARVNKFLKKASGEEVKAAYVQDDDLLYEDGGSVTYEKGGKFNDEELLRKYKNGESIGFTAIAHLKAKGLIPRADGTKRKSEKYKYEDGGGIFSKKNRKMAMNPFDIEGRINFLKENPELLKDGGLTKEENDLYNIYKTQKFMNLENGGEIKYQIKNNQNKYFSLAFSSGKPTWNESPDMGYIFSKEEAEKMKNALNIEGLSIVEYDKDWWKKESYANGGETSEDITCANCGWEWNTDQSDESDKYVCHKCGFDNTFFYSVFKETKTPEEISKIHNVSLDYVLSQLEEGKKHETEEHTQKGVELGEYVGEIIALHHLEESPDYYEKLKNIENSDTQIDDEEIDYKNLPNIYSVYYKSPEIIEIYDFTDLEEAILHSKMNEKPFEIRNFDGKKILTKENLPSIENGTLKLSELEYKSGGKVESYEINDFLNEQKDEADALLMSRKSQIMKNMICNAHIENAERQMNDSKNPLVQNLWNEVARLWKYTKSEIDEYSFVYENGGTAGGCGCTKMAKGGLAYGNSHDKGGIPLTVKSTGQDIEIEGGEGVVNKRSMQMRKLVEFQGKKMTPCEVISKINEMGGGVKFKCDDVKEIIEKDGNFK